MTVGPGPVSAIVACGGRTLSLTIRPNRAAAWNTIALAIGSGGTALHGARVTLSFAMPSMAMGTQSFVLREEAPGVYTYLGPAIVMPGRWNLTLRAVPRRGPLFTALIADRVL
jgi:FixH